MAGTKIQAGEHPIGDIFSDDYRFTIPRYQRPYTWTTEQAGEMFDDLLAASSNKLSLEDTDPYFLGSIVLVKAENDPQAEVVDGQQRLTTLTISAPHGNQTKVTSEPFVTFVSAPNGDRKTRVTHISPDVGDRLMISSTYKLPKILDQRRRVGRRLDSSS